MLLILGPILSGAGTVIAQTPITTIENAQGTTVFQLNSSGDLILPSDPQSGTNARLRWSRSSGTLQAGANTQATAFAAAALNQGTTASGMGATALGANTTAQSRASLVIGQYNTIEGDPNLWDPSDPLFVAGNALGPTQRSNALLLRKNGNMTIAGTLTENSDRRLKTQVEPLGDGVLQALGQIRPVYFRFKNETTHPTGRQIGLIAQEVQTKFPELISKGADGYLSLAYPKMTAVLLKGLQEQQTTVEQQRARIDSLETRVDRLERLQRRVAELESRSDSSLLAGLPGSGLLLGLLLGGLLGAGLLWRRQN